MVLIRCEVTHDVNSIPARVMGMVWIVHRHFVLNDGQIHSLPMIGINELRSRIHPEPE